MKSFEKLFFWNDNNDKKVDKFVNFLSVTATWDIFEKSTEKVKKSAKFRHFLEKVPKFGKKAKIPLFRYFEKKGLFSHFSYSESRLLAFF